VAWTSASQAIDAPRDRGRIRSLTTEKFIEIRNIARSSSRPCAHQHHHRSQCRERDAYYGKAVRPVGLARFGDEATDYGHRGVPNVLLAAPLTSDGTWNSAHFKNKEYDGLVSQYVAALDLGSQRAVAGKIQTLLLDETPVIFSYFYNFLTATTQGVTGVETTAMAHVFLAQAMFH
jgi:peptide/nickel transport system substrate-binding protein